MNSSNIESKSQIKTFFFGGGRGVGGGVLVGE